MEKRELLSRNHGVRLYLQSHLALGHALCLRGFVMMKRHCFCCFASWPSGFIKIHTEKLLSQWNGGDSDHGAGMNHRFPLGGHNW